jgi:BirA family biotin operon repressor/biotin-[acetyl-CoA-carboxylase] ligase
MSGWPQGVQKRVYQTLDSTMAEASRLSAELTGPTWIFTERQTAGKGRRGRDWIDPLGNFAATLCFYPDGAMETRAQRSFVAALALRDAVAAAIGDDCAISLKWPNDVLLNGAKLAGILLESRGDMLAIGFGVNLMAAPNAATLKQYNLPPVSLLAATGTRLFAIDFLELLASAYARWEDRFVMYGFAPIRQAWLEHAARLGQVITAHMGDNQVTGVFETIDAQGVLVLNAEDGRHLIAAADVFF